MTDINVLDIDTEGLNTYQLYHLVEIDHVLEVLKNNGYYVSYEDEDLYMLSNSDEDSLSIYLDKDSTFNWNETLNKVIGELAYEEGKTEMRVLNEMLTAAGHRLVVGDGDCD